MDADVPSPSVVEMKHSKFLSGKELNAYRNAKDRELPERGGLKDFEPDGSWLQGKRLEKMYQFRREVLQEEHVERSGMMARGEWKPELGRVHLSTTVRKMLKSAGYSENGMQLLYPEEALFYMEVGSLEVWFGGIPVSLQQAYATFLPPGGEISLEEYQVYAHLSRLGFILLRHTGSSNISKYERALGLDKLAKKKPKKKHKKEKRNNAELEGESNSVPTKKLKVVQQKTEADNTGSSCDTSSVLDTSQQTCAMETENSHSSLVDPQQTISSVDYAEKEPIVIERTKEVRSLYTDWNFSALNFPDVYGCDGKVVIPPVERHLLPSSEMPSAAAAINLERRNNVWMRRRQQGGEEYGRSSQLDFSLADWSHGRRRKSRARNWAEYKQEVMEKKDDEDDVKRTPVSHLWEDEVTPLIRPQDATSTVAILERLNVIRNCNVSLQRNLGPEVEHGLKTVFDVYMPTSQFRKTSPGLPHHRICVMRCEDPPPNLSLIAYMTRQHQDGVPLHWALVDNGDIAFYTFNDIVIPLQIPME